MPREIAHKALYGLFASWLGLTLLGQRLYRDQTRRSRLDKLVLILPDWRFFAPNPCVNDHHLLVRDTLADGTVTGWRQISTVEERRWSHALWHPHRRAEKTIFDLTAELLRYLSRNDYDSMGRRADPSLQLCMPYVTLLTHVASAGHPPDAVATQFLIAVSGGYETEEEPMMVFLSELHPLRANG